MIQLSFLLHLRQMVSRKPAETGDDAALLAPFIGDHDEDYAKHKGKLEPSTGREYEKLLEGAKSW